MAGRARNNEPMAAAHRAKRTTGIRSIRANAEKQFPEGDDRIFITVTLLWCQLVSLRIGDGLKTTSGLFAAVTTERVSASPLSKRRAQAVGRRHRRPRRQRRFRRGLHGVVCATRRPFAPQR